MGKITKKLNGVFFESSLDTSGWFTIGLLIGLFVMITVMAAGAGEMVGDMLLQAIVSGIEMLTPLLEGWGNTEAGMMDKLFAGDEASTTTIVIFVVVAVGIIGLFTFLTVKFPEKFRKKEECVTF